MGKSFQEQMLALGLVDKKKASQNKKQKHQSKKQQAKKGKLKPVVDENAIIAQKALEKKKARAQQLNKERDEKLQKRANEARIKQLIEQNKREKDASGVAYKFNFKGKINRIFVAQDVADQLSRGVLGIVALGNGFEIVDKATIQKLSEIDPRLFFVLISAEDGAKKEADPDDPYAEYQIPDDLMW